MVRGGLLMIQEDVWEWPAILHHGQICLANVIDFWLNAFDVIFYGIFTPKIMRYSLSVRWAGDWLVSSGEDPDNETSGAKYSCTLGSLVVLSSHLTQGLYALMTDQSQSPHSWNAPSSFVSSQKAEICLNSLLGEFGD